MSLRDRLPWRRRVREIQAAAAEARKKQLAVHDDWIPLARDLHRIDRELALNDWTATAKRIFSGKA